MVWISSILLSQVLFADLRQQPWACPFGGAHGFNLLQVYLSTCSMWKMVEMEIGISLHALCICHYRRSLSPWLQRQLMHLQAEMQMHIKRLWRLWLWHNVEDWQRSQRPNCLCKNFENSEFLHRFLFQEHRNSFKRPLTLVQIPKPWQGFPDNLKGRCLNKSKNPNNTSIHQFPFGVVFSEFQRFQSPCVFEDVSWRLLSSLRFFVLKIASHSNVDIQWLKQVTFRAVFQLLHLDLDEVQNSVESIVLIHFAKASRDEICSCIGFFGMISP